MATYILLIEGVGADSSESLCRHLEGQDYQLLTANTPEIAGEQITTWPDLIVLNHSNTLPFDSDRIISRNFLKIPLVVVGNKAGFNGEITVDTIMVAPHHPQQLAQAVRKATSKQQSRFIRLPGLVLDCYTRQILCEGQVHSLTPKEFKLLHLLMSQPNQVVGRKAIMEKVWETDYLGDTRTLDVHICWLRQKIEVDPSCPQRLVTVRRLGYRLVIPALPDPTQSNG